MDALGPVGPVHQKGRVRLGRRPATYLDWRVANYLDPVGGSLGFQGGFEVSWGLDHRQIGKREFSCR